MTINIQHCLALQSGFTHSEALQVHAERLHTSHFFLNPLHMPDSTVMPKQKGYKLELTFKRALLVFKYLSQLTFSFDLRYQLGWAFPFIYFGISFSHKNKAFSKMPTRVSRADESCIYRTKYC